MSRLHRPFGHEHPHPDKPAGSAGPCCWVATGNPADGAMCLAHERAVGEAVVRDAGAVHRPGMFDVTDLDRIDTDRPDSGTPGRIEGRGEDR